MSESSTRIHAGQRTQLLSPTNVLPLYDDERWEVLAPKVDWEQVIIEGYNPEHKTPVGYDFTWSKVYDMLGSGTLERDGKNLPVYHDISPDKDRVWLNPGAYLLDFAECVSIPAGYAGFMWPRSSLVRMGADLATAIWDAGYTGRSSTGLVVYHQRGVTLQRGARVGHMVLLPMATVTTLYTGQYQGEGL